MNTSNNRPLTFSIPRAEARTTPPLCEVLPSSLTEKVERFARPLYAPKEIAAYHHWGHVEETLAAMEELVVAAGSLGVSVDTIALRHAVLLHDGLALAPHRMLGFVAPEHLSGFIAYNFLRAQGAPDEHARRVEQCIHATHFLVEPQSAEEIIIRAADLMNVGGPWEPFLEKSKLLHAERCALSGEAVSFEEFAYQSIRFLSLYAWRFLSLRSYEEGTIDASTWHREAVRNLTELFALVNGGRSAIKIRVQLGLAKGLRLIPSKGDFCIGCEDDALLREREVAAYRLASLGGFKDSAMLVVPGNLRTLPFVEGSVDELYLASDEEPVTADPFAVMARGGLIRIAEGATAVERVLSEGARNRGFATERDPIAREFIIWTTP